MGVPCLLTESLKVPRTPKLKWDSLVDTTSCILSHILLRDCWPDDSTAREQKILHLASPGLCSMYLLPLLILKCILFYCNKSYWVGQKVHSGFSVRWHRKTQQNFLANPITIITLLNSVNLTSEIIKPRVILGTLNWEVTSLWGYPQ